MKITPDFKSRLLMWGLLALAFIAVEAILWWVSS